LWAADDAYQADGIGVLQVSIDGRDYNARLNRDQVNTDEGDTYPRVNNDAFVQYTIENVD
jgi:hypothetical protein